MQFFSEFLRTHIREKYYNFMNDIQTEVSFFEWFDKYYKPKILSDRNTIFLLQKEAIHRPLTTPDTIIITDKTTNHAHIVCNTPSLTRTRLLTPNHAIDDNIHFATKQTLMTTNNTNQQVTDNIDLAKK